MLLLKDILFIIFRHYISLNRRVENDVRHQEILESQLRREKREKLKSMHEIEHKTRDVEDLIESYSDYNRKQNGQTDNVVISKSPSQNNSNSDISSKSSDSFPPIYYGNLKDEFMNNRPKSATQIVKEHLELDRPRRPTLKHFTTNRTAPVALYGIKLPHSAGERRRHLTEARRYLKSAGDSIFVHSNLPNMINTGPDGDDLHKQLFELKSSIGVNVNSTKLHINKPSDKNGVPCLYRHSNIETSEICVIDIN